MGDAQLIEGDCLAVLPTLAAGSADAVVTSPPYAEQRQNTYGGIPEKDYPDWFVGVMEAIRPILKPSGSILVNIREHRGPDGISDYVHRTRFAVRAAGWCEVEELIWRKPNAVPCGNTRLPRRSWERILWFALKGQPYCDAKDRERGSRAWRGATGLWRWGERSGTRVDRQYRPPTECRFPRHPDIIDASTSERYVGHPAKFPIKLACQLVRLVTPPGGLVLDPFVGSGTTLVAAVQEGRRAIGIEQVPEYAAIARRRIAAAVPAYPLFMEATE